MNGIDTFCHPFNSPESTIAVTSEFPCHYLAEIACTHLVPHVHTMNNGGCLYAGGREILFRVRGRNHLVCYPPCAKPSGYGAVAFAAEVLSTAIGIRIEPRTRIGHLLHRWFCDEQLRAEGLVNGLGEWASHTHPSGEVRPACETQNSAYFDVAEITKLLPVRWRCEVCRHRITGRHREVGTAVFSKRGGRTDGMLTARVCSPECATKYDKSEKRRWEKELQETIALKTARQILRDIRRMVNPNPSSSQSAESRQLQTSQG